MTRMAVTLPNGGPMPYVSHPAEAPVVPTGH
jgi:hypothetical protein